MNIKEVSITKAATINLGNFESARVEIGMVADINKDEDFCQAVEDLSLIVGEQLKTEFRQVLAKQAAKAAKSDITEGH